MYFRQTKLKLPFKTTVEKFKSRKINLQMNLDDSKDKVIKSLNPTLKTGKKWKVSNTGQKLPAKIIGIWSFRI